MKKKKFYVTVGSGSIVDNKTDESFEFEIEATDEQIDRLQELFEDTAAAETAAGTRGLLLPTRSEDHNEGYDSHLGGVYRMLYELGTPETKAHIEKMNVLNGPIAPAAPLVPQ
ncbi:hypothetical protein SD70_32320 [Gordoniibacillus kamchatkensis]|uniref:Hydrolase n=1 Tax=Gordoniibacillus kamchatkensis TaxID=1590651 RepID=A0ABR5A1W5_9BACL|nr:hypothetical protein [Paenibacillus sp. VKM B-2647]KIL34986.1 hypothetical protein SD70_32320 [Paenibacillus sp. VKM B-2647]